MVFKNAKAIIFYPYAVTVLDSNSKFSYKAASDTFNYQPRSLKKTLYDTIQWLKITKVKPDNQDRNQYKDVANTLHLF